MFPVMHAGQDGDDNSIDISAKSGMCLCIYVI